MQSSSSATNIATQATSAVLAPVRPPFFRWNWLAVPTGLALIVAGIAYGIFGQKLKAGALLLYALTAPHALT